MSILSNIDYLENRVSELTARVEELERAAEVAMQKGYDLGCETGRAFAVDAMLVTVNGLIPEEHRAELVGVKK